MAFGMSGSKAGAIRVIQIVAAGITALLSVAVVGTSGDVLHTFNIQRANQNPWFLPLWPNHFDTTATKTAVGTGAAIALLNIVFLIVALVPRVNLVEKVKLGALTAVGVSLPSILLAVGAMVVSNLMDERTSNQNMDTLRSWTCRFSGDAATGSPIPAEMSNDNFNKLCSETTFAFYAMIPVLILQAIVLGSAITQFFLGSPSEHARAGKESPVSSY